MVVDSVSLNSWLHMWARMCQVQYYDQNDDDDDDDNDDDDEDSPLHWPIVDRCPEQLKPE